ncbi:MAG: response regulator [Deltaproteobacteria bacterium]
MSHYTISAFRRSAASHMPNTLPNILIVDDSPTVRQFMKIGLSRLPAKCDDATDGRVALEMLAAGRYDLIFCDINMPTMGGFAFLEALRQRPAPPPVVMVTTEGALEEQQHAMSLGASFFLTKPVQLPKLLEVARRLLAAAPAVPA